MLWRYYLCFCFIWKADNFLKFIFHFSTCSTVWPSSLLFVRWINGRMEEGWKVNVFTVKPCTSSQTFKSEITLKATSSQSECLALFIYLSFTLRSSPWGCSPFFFPLLWGSTLTLSNVLQVKMTTPALVSAFRLMTLAFLRFLVLSWEAHPPHHSCPCSLSYRIRDREDIWVSWTLIL